MSFYYDKGRLWHDCPLRGSRQLSVSPNTVIGYGYYEDGYYRGLKKGKNSKEWFNKKNFVYTNNAIRCKVCGEEVEFDDLGRFV